MKTAETNVLGLRGLKVVDAELLKKWRYGFESEGSPDEGDEGVGNPSVPEGDDDLGGDPPFEEPSEEFNEGYNEPEEPFVEEAGNEEFIEPEPPVEDPMEDPTAAY